MKKDEIRKKLDPLTYHVTQQKGTEPAFTGKYWDEHADGSYHCAVCGQKLFESNAKFDSGTGWPSFYQAVAGSVVMKQDDSHGMHRTEVLCSKCGAHLGHVFPSEPTQSNNQEFCINSCALDLKKKAN